MPKMYLFYPVANVLDPRGRVAAARVDRGDESANVFERNAGQCFVDCGNPPAQIIESSVNLAWSKDAPPGGDEMARKIEVNPQVTRAVKAVWADKKESVTYFGTVPAARGSASFRSYFGRATLSGLTNADVLFVIGHGSYTGGYLTHEEEYDAVEHAYKVRADMLANVLKHNGLPMSHVFIKANMCFGGGLSTGAEVGVTFSKSLAVELGKLGYARILVGGYQYAVVHDGDDTRLAGFEYGVERRQAPRLNFIAGTRLKKAYAVATNPPSALPMFEKDTYRCWYDAKGTRVRWNEPDLEYERIPILAREDKDFAAMEARMAAQAEWAEQLKSKGLG